MLVGGGRDPEAEEQQAADLAVQRAGFGEPAAQVGQVGLRGSVVEIEVGSMHERIERRIFLAYYYVIR